MALTEKKKKAIAAAVVYLVEQEDAANTEAMNDFRARNMWVNMGKASMMENRARVQRRGRALPMR